VQLSKLVAQTNKRNGKRRMIPRAIMLVETSQVMDIKNRKLNEVDIEI